MSQPQQKKPVFPSFGKTSQKQSFNQLSKKINMMSNTKGFVNSYVNSSSANMNNFYQSKVLKGIKLNNLKQINSIHSSVYQPSNSSQDNSLRNVVNSSYWNNTQQSIVFNKGDEKVKAIKISQINKQKQIQKKTYQQPQNSMTSNRHSLSNIRSRSSSNLSASNSIQAKNPAFYLTQRQCPLTQSNIQKNSQTQSLLNLTYWLKNQKQKQLQKSQLPIQQQVQLLFTQNFNRNFIRSLIQYMNKDWSQNEGSLLEDKKVQMLINIIVQKFTFCDQLINDFIGIEFDLDYGPQNISETPSFYSLRQIKLISSILFKQCQKAFEQMRKLFEQLIGKLPQDGIMQQQFILEQLKKSILEVYDPKYTYSSAKMKERFKLYYQAYCSKRISLQTEIKHKLKRQLSFIKQMQNYLGSYQKQLMKLKLQIQNLQKEKQHLLQLLQKKTTFKPIQIDFKKLAQMKQEAEDRIKDDFSKNIVQFHNSIHQKNKKTIQTLKKQNQQMRNQVEHNQRQKDYHAARLEQYLISIPKKRDASTQIFNLPLDNNSSSPSNLSENTAQSSPPHQLALYPNFLTNVVTPFTFNQKITCSLISIITIDKVLYDYEPIRSKSPLIPFKQYVYEWFIIRTGSKKIAQILIKNFVYSVKKYRNKHKRFSTFNKICGYSGIKGKNLQENIQHLFYQTHLAWYFLIKLALMFRKRLNQNPNGYHMFPPINCEQIFKLSLRKSYQLIEEFFLEEGIPVPENLTQKVDHYAINEISRFKQNDEQFQKNSLQEIHILRQMNFDVIAGFVVDYVASERAVILQGLLRSIHLKQEQEKNTIGYGQFEIIYRKYYKQKRSKIQLIYSKFCLCNMYDVLNAHNMTPVIFMCIQDDIPLRGIFERHQSFKSLIMSEKQSMNGSSSKYEKKVQTNPNSFEHFRQRYYNEFYDFYDMTIMLQEIFKIIKGMVRKKLKKMAKDQKFIQSLLQTPRGQIVGQRKPQILSKQQYQQDQQQDDQQQAEQQQKQKKALPTVLDLQKLTVQKSYIQQKLQQWNKIQQRIPHFTNNILTIQQIIIHNMRRKQMFQGCEFAWRTLREILIAISK